jgi:hypothetical protein
MILQKSFSCQLGSEALLMKEAAYRINKTLTDES